MNRALLEYEIKRAHKTIDSFCVALGISRSTYYRKVNGRSEFTQGEILKAMGFLQISSPVDIFFAH